MAKSTSTLMEGYCTAKDCRQKRPIGPSIAGEPAIIRQLSTKTGGSRYQLIGYCRECNGKVYKFLSKEMAEDAALVKAHGLIVGQLGSDEHVEVSAAGLSADTKSKSSKSKKAPTNKKSVPKGEVTVVTKKTATKKTAPKKSAPPKNVPSSRKSPPKGRSAKVSFPLKLVVMYGRKGEPKKKYTALMKDMGLIIYDKVSYSSPTLAAAAITETSVNGWKFWKYIGDDGELHVLDEIRDPSEVRSRGESVSGSKPGLPPYSTEVGPVPLPREDLPKRNSAALCAAYFVISAKKYEQSGSVVAYLYGDRRLVRVLYNKKGTPSAKEELGVFPDWPAAQVKIGQDAGSRKYIRVKVS